MYMIYSLRGDVQAGADCVSKSLVELNKSRGFLTVNANGNDGVRRKISPYAPIWSDIGVESRRTKIHNK
jgi:hypothetical protein